MHRREAHIWTWSLDTDDAADLGLLLSPDERQRAQAFRYEQHRSRWISSRAGLRIILGRYTQTYPGELKFSTTSYGKPVLSPPWDTVISFNLSHSDALAAAAITDGAEIGIDVERQRDVPECTDIARRHFSPREYEVLCRLPDASRYQAFFRCWTRKEAYLKANGSGLSTPLQDFDVTVSPQEPARVISIRGDVASARQWQMFDFEPREGYSGAVVVKSEAPPKIIHHQLSQLDLRCL